MVNRIIDLIQNSEYEYFGLRKDDYNYNVGDICNNSHQLFQDAQYDYDDNLLYPLIEEGIYKGFFDAGELNGTCAIEISLNNSENVITKRLETMKMYPSKNLYLIAGNYCEVGNDINEIIIENAIVIDKFISN